MKRGRLAGPMKLCISVFNILTERKTTYKFHRLSIQKGQNLGFRHFLDFGGPGILRLLSLF